MFSKSYICNNFVVFRMETRSRRRKMKINSFFHHILISFWFLVRHFVFEMYFLIYKWCILNLMSRKSKNPIFYTFFVNLNNLSPPYCYWLLNFINKNLLLSSNDWKNTIKICILQPRYTNFTPKIEIRLVTVFRKIAHFQITKKI